MKDDQPRIIPVKFGHIQSVVYEMLFEKIVYRHTDGQRDNGQNVIIKAHLVM